MLNMQVNGFDSLAKKVKQMEKSLGDGKQQFLYNHILKRINISSKVIRHLNRLIYSQPDPKWYKRTNTLKDSLTIEMKGESISVFMDGDYLRRASNREPSMYSGYDESVKGVNYAHLVETGYIFQNVDNPVEDFGRNYIMGERPFMQSTWEEVQNEVNVSEIMTPLLRMWSR